MKKILSFFLLTFLVTIVMAQSPKREFRATWLTTVWSIDWPHTKITSTGNVSQINAQKNEMIHLLDSLVSARMNAVCFQVRSRADAMYKSSYEPWSTDLVSTRGLEPGYDPLAFVLEEAHKRGIEVHAWVNPYRFESQTGQWTGEAGDYRKDHPTWVLDHNGASILNPGMPEVRQRISDIIEEMITNYDLDGVIFDDYFYLSGTTEDQDLYDSSDTNGMSIEDWRRSNVNMMVAKVYNMIQTVKPYIRFGVSPAGIWDVNTAIATSYGLTLPDVSGGYAYHGIYCDPIAWLAEGTVDYISPQVYWTVGSTYDYAKLTPWWSETAEHFGRQCYISHSISDLVASAAPQQKAPRLAAAVDPADQYSEAGISELERNIIAQNASPSTRSFGLTEVGAQVGVNRSSDSGDAPGSIFFSTKKIRTKGFTTYLRNEVFTQQAMVPAIHWKTRAVVDPVVSNIVRENASLSWDAATDNVRYAIYALPTTEKENALAYTSSSYYLGLSYTTSFTLPTTLDFSTTTFAVAVVDRYGNEYTPVVMGETAADLAAPQLTSPVANAAQVTPFSFQWESVPSAISYVLQVATDASFDTLICGREVLTTAFSTALLPPLSQGITYYWRVKAKGIGSSSDFSPAQSFSLLTFKVIAPVFGDDTVGLTPTFQWSDVAGISTYTLEISSTTSFSSSYLVYSKEVNATQFELPAGVLSGLTTYYVRVSAMLEGDAVSTPISSFTTQEVLPVDPLILSPLQDDNVEGDQVTVTWNNDPNALQYRLELSTSSNFPRGTTIKTLDKTIGSFTFEDLEKDTYYVRVRADYKSLVGSLVVTEHTEWSPVVSFNYLSADGVTLLNNQEWSAYVYPEQDSYYLHLYMDAPTLATIRIFSSTGVLVKSWKQQAIPQGDTTIELINKKYVKGVYFIEISTPKNEKKLLKIII